MAPQTTKTNKALHRPQAQLKAKASVRTARLNTSVLARCWLGKLARGATFPAPPWRAPVRSSLRAARAAPTANDTAHGPHGAPTATAGHRPTRPRAPDPQLVVATSYPARHSHIYIMDYGHLGMGGSKYSQKYINRYHRISGRAPLMLTTHFHLPHPMSHVPRPPLPSAPALSPICTTCAMS
jgi:hypothetical protein